MVLAVSKANGWENDFIPRIASGFGGGLGLRGEICGALTGGAMVIGLVHGRDIADDTRDMMSVHAKTGEYAQRFAEVNEGLRCRDLIDLDLTSRTGVVAYYARNLQEKKCAGILENAVRVLYQHLEVWENGQS